ncbi:hypothetical protein HDIA_0732 [Hartmannibacter diazotrophicus]|uniref:Uncharacterized protein n=1 Tax=Hartmannibacter diazotrophicus TaxID=1482074 RepID=A0A2C9D229_9HYPH|nr:hypothetical protein [Hartmannibacter diazotrophicus]SON54273.1 hypothetical protein HDIA_0732 [Hartmannibacter diazotrophicus]
MNGAESIAAERQRQINEEGWTPEHDDEHTKGEIAKAAACYAWASATSTTFREIGEWWDGVVLRRLWPWDRTWWKPTDRRRDLVKAGALIAAEIDRAAALANEPNN